MNQISPNKPSNSGTRAQDEEILALNAAILVSRNIANAPGQAIPPEEQQEITDTAAAAMDLFAQRMVDLRSVTPAGVNGCQEPRNSGVIAIPGARQSR